MISCEMVFNRFLKNSKRCDMLFNNVSVPEFSGH